MTCCRRSRRPTHPQPCWSPPNRRARSSESSCCPIPSSPAACDYTGKPAILNIRHSTPDMPPSRNGRQLSYQFPMQTPPLMYPRRPLALTHAAGLGCAYGLARSYVVVPVPTDRAHRLGPGHRTGHECHPPIDVSAKTNTATAARRRNHCFIADFLLLSIQSFRPPRHPVNGHEHHSSRHTLTVT